MSKKKIGIIVAAIVAVAAGAGGLWFFLKGGGFGGSGSDKVYVESVKSLSGASAGTQNRFSGVVEPQETWKINKESEKTVKQLLVKEGDAVEVGTPLIEYDTDEIKDKIAQANLELEGIGNEISDYYSQIDSLSSERNTVPEEDKFQYTTQIQSLQAQIKQSEYSKQSKALEISKLEESVNNAVVTSKLAGVVKSINENGYDQNTGEELPYMTVLATGDYRVKGTINEQNIWTLQEGQKVLVRSRVDEEKTWNGSIKEIDTKNEITNNNSGGFTDSSSGSSETVTKYPFYVTLDSMDGLILGQHVFIELDAGQTEKKEGVWLYESYLVNEDDNTFVWADNGNKKLEKRSVEVGDLDEESGMYEIKSGLTEDDFIAFPMAALYEGVTTVTDASEVDYDSPLYKDQNEGGDSGEDAEDGGAEGAEGDTEDLDSGAEGGSLDDGGSLDGAQDRIINGGAVDGVEGIGIDGSGGEEGSEDSAGGAQEPGVAE